jgi:hypothetical protein
VQNLPQRDDETDQSARRAMSDEDGPNVAAYVYRDLLLNEEKAFDLEDIPYVLDDAVQMLRQQNVPAHRWATFIHIGA